MLKLNIILLTLCISVNQIYSQIDPAFCSSTLIPVGQNEPFPNINIASKYQLNIERNRQGRNQTEEIQEYYDGIDNYGVSVNLFGGIDTRTYSFYDTNQILVVKDSQCSVYDLQQFIGLTDFYVTNIDGKPHIISAIGLLLQNTDVKLTYIGKNNIRGIPVKEWQACLFVEKPSKGTVKITISYSDPDLWFPAIYATGFKQFPVQVKNEFKDMANGAVYVEYDVITQFRPGSLLNMENFNTPSGVFCPGRANRQPIKFVVPDSFSYTAAIAVSKPDASDYSGTLGTVRVDIDYGKKLARYDFYDKGQRFTDIHDFDTGLSFKRNRYTGECEVSTLDPNSGEAHNSYEFFQFNQQPEFQYVGQRKVRGMIADVWIAPRLFNGANLTFEWYFMTDGFVVQENMAVEQNEPILLKIQPYGDKKNPTFIQISSFERTRINYFDFDVSDCGNTKNQHVKFILDTDDYYDLKEQQQLLRLEVLVMLQKITTLRLLRLSRLEIIFDNGYVFVQVTLLEKQTISGNPNKPNDEISLADAVKKLENAINSGQFKLKFQTSDKKIFEVTAESKSLETLSQNNGRYVFTENQISNGYSGGSLAGFIIGFLLIGLVLGLVGGVFLILRRNVSLPGPLSVFNPTFNKSNA